MGQSPRTYFPSLKSGDPKKKKEEEKEDPFADFVDPFAEFSVTEDISTAPESIDEFVGPPTPPEVIPEEEEEEVVPEIPKSESEWKGLFDNPVWNTANAPLTDAPSQGARMISEQMQGARRNVENPFLASVMGFAEGAQEGLGDAASSMTSPLNLITSLLTGGSGPVAKAGLPQIARMMGMGARGLSAGVGLHGGQEIIQGEGFAEKGAGLLELVGGILGMKQGLPKISKSIIAGEVPKVPVRGVTGTNQLDDLLENIPRESSVVPEGIASPDVSSPASYGPVKEGTPHTPRETPFTSDQYTLETLSSDIAYLREKGKPIPQELLNRMEELTGKGVAEPQHTIVDTKNPHPKNLITDGADVIDEATGEVVDMSIDSDRIDTNARNAAQEKAITAANHPEKKGTMSQNELFKLADGPVDKIGDEKIKAAIQTGNGPSIKLMLKRSGVNTEGPLSVYGDNYGVTGEFVIGDANSHAALAAYRELGIKDIPVHVAGKLPERIPVEGLGPYARMYDKTGLRVPTQAGAPPIKPPVKPPVLAEIPEKPSINPQTNQPIDPVKFKPNVKRVNDKEVILTNPTVETVQQMNDGNFYTKKVNDDGSLVMTKRAPRPKKAGEPESLAGEVWNLSRGMMSVDLPYMTSAAFRQAKPHIGTPRWFKAWDTSARVFGSEQSFQNVMTRINSNPYFKKRLINGKIAPSLAEEAGVKIYDLNGLTHRDDVIRSQMAERIPLYGRYIRASNRAYVGFGNDVASNHFISLIDDLKAQGKNPELDIPTLKAIGEVVNHSVGRGKLGVQIPGFKREFSADSPGVRSVLSNVFFSPSLITQNIRMLNPSTYIHANPAVRKQYVYGMLRTMAAWGTFASIAKMSGGEVNINPTNSDFGKIRIGDTRIDVPGGLQQFITLIAKETLGETTNSTSKKTTQFGGKGYNPPTEFSTAVDFASNKLHPNLKLIVDLARATGYRSVHMGDRVFQLALPMYTNDINEIMEEHPEMVPIIMGLNSIGMGAQTYDGGKIPPKITPLFGLDKYDYEYKGGRPWRK